MPMVNRYSVLLARKAPSQFDHGYKTRHPITKDQDSKSNALASAMRAGLEPPMTLSFAIVKLSLRELSPDGKRQNHSVSNESAIRGVSIARPLLSTEEQVWCRQAYRNLDPIVDHSTIRPSEDSRRRQVVMPESLPRLPQEHLAIRAVPAFQFPAVPALQVPDRADVESQVMVVWTSGALVVIVHGHARMIGVLTRQQRRCTVQPHATLHSADGLLEPGEHAQVHFCGLLTSCL
nr:hypothetical protein CFP56_31810 [Quercus suber]